VRIINSTGSYILDNTIRSEILKSTFPSAYGTEELEPHDFQFSVTLEPPVANFAMALRQDIVRQTTPGLRKDWGGDHGYVLIEFYYQDGAISDAKVTYNSDGEQKLAEDVVSRIMHLKVPPPIPLIAGKKIIFIEGFCFMMNNTACNQLEKIGYGTVR
jgi:hypothetical protein